jgi:ADP-ribose pyrophosphatase YjhB (NUDIX family)
MSWHHRLLHRAAHLYWRVWKPRTLGVRAVVLDEKDRVALVRHTYTDQWYLPGGGVKKGESFETALHRELKEEVALFNARIERVLGVYHSRRDSKDDHIVIFAVRVDDRAAQDLRPADPMEIEDVRWFAMDGMPAEASPATRRRVAEYQAGIVGLGAW